VLTWFSIFGNLFNLLAYVQYLKSHVITVAYSWCSGHFTSI